MKSIKSILFTLVLSAITLALASSHSHANEAEELFQKLFGQKMKQTLATRDFDDDMALTHEILGSVASVKGQAQLIGVLCDKAHALCSRRPEGYHLATEAMALMHQQVPQRRREALEKIVALGRKIYIRSKPSERKRAAQGMVRNMMLLAAEQDDADDDRACVITLRQARQYAIAAKLDNVKEVSNYYERALERQQLIISKRKLEEELLRDAGNTAVAEQLVRMFMVDFDDPARALEFSDRMKNPELANVVKLASRPIDKRTGEELMAVADWYRSQIKHPSADVRKLMATRSANGYKRYIDKNDKGSLTRTRAELSLKQLAKFLGAESLASLASPEPKTNIAKVVGQPGDNEPRTTFRNAKAITRELQRGQWVEVLGLVQSKIHCNGAHQINGPMRDGSVKLMFKPRLNAMADVMIPVVIEGKYQMTVKIETANNGRKFHVYLPGERGWASFTVTLKSTTPAGHTQEMLYEIDQVKGGELVVSGQTVGLPRQQVTMTDASLSWRKERSENTKPPTPIIRAEDGPINIVSVRIRLVKGTVALWDGKGLRGD